MRGLDTYYGRRVTRITDDSDGNWFVELEGGVRVINNDRSPKPDLPNGGAGLRFAMAILGQSDTQMVFLTDTTPPDEYRVKLNPFKYQIFDSDHGPLAWEPQAGGLSDSFVKSGQMQEAPSEPTERLAEGPEGQPEVAAEGREVTEAPPVEPKTKKAKRKKP